MRNKRCLFNKNKAKKHDIYLQSKFTKIVAIKLTLNKLNFVI